MSENILDLIQEKLPSFSKGQKRICAYITEECEKAAFMTAANLGKTVGVSESTVVRFAMELGFDGYPSMQNALRQMVLVRVKDSGHPLKNDDSLHEDNAVSNILREEAERVYQSAEIINQEEFLASIDRIWNCRRLYIIGFHFAAPLAEYMANYMRLLHPDVQVITTSCKKELLERLLFADPMDAALIFGFPSDDEATVFSSQYMQSKGAAVIVVTDSKLSPAAKFCDYSIVAKTGKSFLVESLTAPMGIINGILSVLVNENKTEVAERIRGLEHSIAENNCKEKRGE